MQLARALGMASFLPLWERSTLAFSFLLKGRRFGRKLLPQCLLWYLLRYGTTVWNDIDSCREGQALSCDLTNCTRDLYRYDYGYWARVRAVDNNQHSNWTLTETRFTVDEVILTVGSVTLKVTNNFIFGIIHPPRPKITPPGDEYEQIFKDFRAYKVSIRKIFKQKVQNTTKTVSQENFNLKVPRGMREVCIKVKPYVETRNNQAEWSEEQCLRLTEQDQDQDQDQCEWPRLLSRQRVHKPRKSCLGLLVPALGPELLHRAIYLHTNHGRSYPILLRTILS